MSTSSLRRRVVYWFKNDLRIHDNPTLQEAFSSLRNQRATLPPELVCVYCFDPRNYYSPSDQSQNMVLTKHSFIVASSKLNLLQISERTYKNWERIYSCHMESQKISFLDSFLKDVMESYSYLAKLRMKRRLSNLP